jgi:hypothetical protein
MLDAQQQHAAAAAHAAHGGGGGGQGQGGDARDLPHLAPGSSGYDRDEREFNRNGGGGAAYDRERERERERGGPGALGGPDSKRMRVSEQQQQQQQRERERERDRERDEWERSKRERERDYTGGSASTGRRQISPIPSNHSATSGKGGMGATSPSRPPGAGAAARGPPQTAMVSTAASRLRTSAIWIQTRCRESSRRKAATGSRSLIRK